MKFQSPSNSNYHTIGIDIGSASVRACWNANGEKKVVQKPISIYPCKENRKYITQSSTEIFECILDLLGLIEADVATDSIAVTATCSMVVMEKVTKPNGVFLKSYSVQAGDCEYSTTQDIIMWMDSRPEKETEELNDSLPQESLGKLGGKVIPEMGLPKAKWLSDNTTSNLVCFELYDWFSYLFLVGGYDKDHLVPYVESTGAGWTSPKHFQEAMDGSIRGWSREFLKKIGIRSTLEIGSSSFNINETGLPPVGTPLGYVASGIGSNSLSEKTLVCHGCIDCYSGSLSTIGASSDEKSGSVLSAVAGTSTCFLLSTTKVDIRPIPGIWGPFSQLTALPISVYEFGQPATGKLYERLFAQYSNVLPHSDPSRCFEIAEQQTAALERTYKLPIHCIIRNYFWYIDAFGNRSPYNDFTMGESIIDGHNASGSLPSIFDTANLTSFAIRYNLIQEFLCFQTKHILDIFSEVDPLDVSRIHCLGSQASNTRFVKLLSFICNTCVVAAPPQDQDAKYNVASGASHIAALGLNLRTLSSSYTQAWKSCVPAPLSATAVTYNPDDTLSRSDTVLPQLRNVLLGKFEIYKDMARAQRRYRALVAAP
ncbi:Piso0_004772 [Millerozyma farinosa CBS 7064]|uniref:Piso0_004772 protein n=1 Tax=Pichia sorbitophila (strain ATCC MYA-4447 / BCRC 22081 / CBS 7064 / NBRC 10061 / NRRL Y-12695) TaxID=559304 RepID=G8Y3C2_PICSO|nr:Piso0_004772 [Millerozyma farinosa CBS 7064]